MKKPILLTIFLAFILSIGYAQSYEFLSVYQDDGSSDHIVEAPSFYWPGECDVDVNLFVTATHGTSFSLSNQWFSPNETLIATSVPTPSNNIICLSQGVGNTDVDRANFYESRSETLSTASSTDTWLRTLYNCTADANDIITYSNTNVLDAYDAFPYGYIESTGGYCQIGTPGTLPTTNAQIGTIITNIEDAYDTACSATDLEKAEIGGAAASCVFNRFFGSTFWYYVPFNSGSSGLVNISLTEQDEIQTGLCNGAPAMSCITNKTFLYNTFLETNVSIGTSVPLNRELILQRETDYWLLIGTECTGATGGSGSCTIGFNHTDYQINILDCEPTFVCGDWSDCSGNIQTRTCEDVSDCNVPATIETRSCFDVPTFDLSLGFEEIRTITDGVYICTKQFFTCSDVLSTINAEYPVNWTVFPDFDDAGVARDNFIKMSSETASVGSRSLKMWYIPPKINEPIPDGTSTQCGNGTTGSFPETTHPYNESLFISQNVTFSNPFPQIRYDVRKCAEPVLQYDYTGDLLGFNCGKLCYASTCNVTPRGRYGVRISRVVENGIITTFPSFSFFVGATNETVNVTDGNIDTYAEFASVTGALVNSTENIFFNGTFLNFTLNVTGGSLPLCINDGATELTRVVIPSADTLFNFNVTLGNISSPINNITFIQCNAPSRTVRMRLFSIRNQVMDFDSDIIFDYIGFAPDTWDEGQIIHDLSNIDLVVGSNYTISLSINPENQFDPFTHCAYIDNFRVTFTELALPDCVSECIEGSIDRRIASLSDGVCTFITQKNSPDCIGDIQDRDAVNSIIAGEGGGDVSDNSTCIDSDNDGIRDDLYIFDTERGFSEIVIDSAACLLLINETAEAQKGVTPLQDAQEWVDWILFLISPIFIFFYITVAIATPVGALIKSWQAFGITFAFMLFIGMLIPVPGGTASVIPLWVGVAMIAVISILIAKELRTQSVGGGGG